MLINFGSLVQAWECPLDSPWSGVLPQSLTSSALQSTRFPNQTMPAPSPVLQWSLLHPPQNRPECFYLPRLPPSPWSRGCCILTPIIHSCAQTASMTGHHTFVLPDLSFLVPVSSSKGLLHLDPRLQSVLYHSCSPSFSSKQPTDEPLRGLAYTWGTTYHCLGKGHRPSPAKKTLH